MAQDLRSYLDLLKRKRPEEFLIVSREVDPAYEITALVVKLEKEARKRPVLLFEKVRGTSFPVLTNLHASRARLALALNAAPDALLTTYLRAMERPIAPRVVRTGAVKDEVRTGKDVNLLDLPQIIHHEGDGGVFLTSAISFAKDPTADIWNCAYNRLMLKGRDTTSIHLTLGKHLWEFHRLAEKRNEPLPVAFVIGAHPAIALGALAIGSVDEDERGIMGGLFGEPLELVTCETSEVEGPAHAELVIEAEIRPHEGVPEGPFGAFPGYSLGERQREVVKVTAITHRRDAIFQDISVAHLDHVLLSTIPIEANLYRAVRAMVPSVKAVRVPTPFTCFVSLEQRIAGQAKNAILAVLGADLYMKRVVVVDHDVDVFDDRQVNWAIATRRQPDRRAGGFARALHHGGVRAGDRVALVIGNRAEFVVALLGALKLGATVAPLDPRLIDEERTRIIDDLAPAVVVHDVAADECDWPSPSSDAPALILYTSGSTGAPKGAVLSQHAVAAGVASWIDPVMALTADDVLLAVLPLSHSYGLNGALLAPLVTGATVGLLERFSPEAVLGSIRDLGVSVFPGVATMFRRLLDADAGLGDLRRLRIALSGAAPCPWPLASEWRGGGGRRATPGPP